MAYQKLISIGILGLYERSITYNIVKEIFVKSGYEIVYNNSKSTIIILALNDKLVLIIGLTTKTIESILDLEIYFDILIQTSLKEDDYSNPSIKSIVSRAKYIIMNIDELYSSYILDENTEGLIITYGLNKKSTITASSFNISNNVEFNLCIQREYNSIDGKTIEPMEVPIVLNLIGKNNIYHGLSAIACGLSCGITINQIQEALFDIKGKYRYLEKIYDKDYIIIDSNCSIPSEYNLIFEEIQNLKYKNIYVVNGIEIDQGIYTIKKNLEVILNWKPILDIKKVFFYIDGREDLISDNIDLLFTKNKLDYKVFFKLNKCIDSAISLLDKNDFLLLIGNECLENSRELISQLM